MGIIDEIRMARANNLTEEQKSGLLKHIKKTLVNNDYVVIYGASHYENQGWGADKDGSIYRAPFSVHTAIKQWLSQLGFSSCRYYNRGGVDQGLKVWF